MRLIDADAITYELWTTEVEVDKSRDNGTYHYFQNRFMVDRRDIESMPTVQQWIPCSERLPNEDEEVLVYLYGNVPVIAWVDSKGRWCSEEFDIAKEDEPVAWMPLPQPYRGDDK